MHGVEVENKRLPRMLVLDAHSFSARLFLFTTRLTSLNSRNSPVCYPHCHRSVWTADPGITVSDFYMGSGKPNLAHSLLNQLEKLNSLPSPTCLFLKRKSKQL